MEQSIIDNHLKAAAAWKATIKMAAKEAREGTSLSLLAQKIEAKIIEEGAGIAFPVNLSIGEEAAHFTPNWKKEEDRVLAETDLLKIDIGTHVKGRICDGAITINLDNKFAKQIEANELALANAISVVKIGTSTDKIGEQIEDTLKSKGFKPVYNLGGHGLGEYDIHAYPSVPNHGNGGGNILEEGAIAIEPFCSTGKGHVSESIQVEIFALNEGRTVRNPHARKILDTAKKYDDLPFAERWLKRDTKIDDFQFTLGMRELMKANCFETFPGLKESKGTMVTQVEKSVLVLEDKVIVLGE